MSFQKILLNSAGIPFEPGVFSGSILFNACRHSDLVSKPSQLSFSSAFRIFVSSKKIKNSRVRIVVHLCGIYKDLCRNFHTDVISLSDEANSFSPVFNWLITPFLKYLFSRFRNLVFYRLFTDF